MDQNYLVTILTLLVVIELAHLLVSFFYQRRAAKAYEQATETQIKAIRLGIKRKRDQSLKEELPGGAYAWLARQVKEAYGYSVEFDEQASITLESTPVLVTSTAKGDRLVISPFRRAELRNRLRDLLKARGRLSVLTEESTVHDIVKKARNDRKRSLDTAGEFFDIEAQKADEELNAGWGDAEVLHMSWVQA